MAPGFLLAGVVAAWACGSADGSPPDCTGDLRCACFENGTCNADLVCRSEVCIEGDATGGSTGNSGGSAATGGSPSATGGTSPAQGGSPSTTGGTSPAQGGMPPSGGAGGTTAQGGSLPSEGGSAGEPDAGSGGAAEGGTGSAGEGQGGTSGGMEASGGEAGAGTTGGAVATGGTNATGGMPGECGNAWNVGEDGYVTSPGEEAQCWHGYGVTSAQAPSTISPLTFEDCSEPCTLCATGVVEADPAASAFVGFNLNQEVGSASTGTLSPSGGSFTVDYDNLGTSPVRVVLSGVNETWCYIPLTSGPITILFSQFNTQCFNNNLGVPYSGQLLESIGLMVPGNEEQTTLYNVCLLSARSTE